MKRQSISVIIPAAGSGRRFRAGARNHRESKIYARLASTPLIVHVLRVFDAIPSVRELLVALRREHIKRFQREVLSSKSCHKRVIVVRGGATRAESVFNCLKHVSRRSTHVCVHDAARPLIQRDWLTQLRRHLNGYDGIVAGRRVVPTVKVIRPKKGEIERTLDRTQLFEAQTPQLFSKQALINAYRLLGRHAFRATDDASLVEASGGRVKAWLHSDSNVKVTTYDDLAVVRNMLVPQKGDSPLKRGLSPFWGTYRFGFGFDRHRLVSRRPFYIGGVRLASTVGPLGHSDGDPLLHAVTDGILGAIGAGDIGDFFPPSSRKWKNARSDIFLKKAMRLARKHQFQTVQVDATIFLERPKLGATKKKIQRKLSQLLSLPVDQVGLKAKTAEGLGPEGLGDAVSCHALVVLGPVDS